MAEDLPRYTRPGVRLPAMHKVNTVVYACNFIPWEVEARSEIRGHPGLHSKCEANLSYLSPCLKREKKNVSAKICNFLVPLVWMLSFVDIKTGRGARENIKVPNHVKTN